MSDLTAGKTRDELAKMYLELDAWQGQLCRELELLLKERDALRRELKRHDSERAVFVDDGQRGCDSGDRGGFRDGVDGVVGCTGGSEDSKAGGCEQVRGRAGS